MAIFDCVPGLYIAQVKCQAQIPVQAVPPTNATGNQATLKRYPDYDPIPQVNEFMQQRVQWEVLNEHTSDESHINQGLTVCTTPAEF